MEATVYFIEIASESGMVMKKVGFKINKGIKTSQAANFTYNLKCLYLRLTN